MLSMPPTFFFFFKNRLEQVNSILVEYNSWKLEISIMAVPP